MRKANSLSCITGLGDAKCLDMLTGLFQNPPNDTVIDINVHLSLARYRCRNGFKLTGNETLSCRNGKWMETTKPLCKGNLGYV